MNDLIGKVDSKARKPWITQEMIKKKFMNEGNGRMYTTRKE